MAAIDGIGRNKHSRGSSNFVSRYQFHIAPIDGTGRRIHRLSAARTPCLETAREAAWAKGQPHSS